MAAPVLLVADEREGEARLAHIPPERRGALVPATPARAAELIQEYVDAGFGGFTFGNTMLPGESLDLAAELIRSFGIIRRVGCGGSPWPGAPGGSAPLAQLLEEECGGGNARAETTVCSVLEESEVEHP